MSKPLPETEKLRIAEDILTRQLGWISSCDTKITAIFAFQTGSVALLASKSGDFLHIFQRHRIDGHSLLLIMLTIVFVGFLARSLFYSFRTLYPHVKSNYKSLIFFGTIPSDREAFQEAFFNATQEQIEEDLSANIVTTAHIARKKFRYIKYTIESFIIAGASGALLLILLSAS